MRKNWLKHCARYTKNHKNFCNYHVKQSLSANICLILKRIRNLYIPKRVFAPLRILKNTATFLQLTPKNSSNNMYDEVIILYHIIFNKGKRFFTITCSNYFSMSLQNIKYCFTITNYQTLFSQCRGLKIYEKFAERYLYECDYIFFTKYDKIKFSYIYIVSICSWNTGRIMWSYQYWRFWSSLSLSLSLSSFNLVSR